jgi:hypothetical protein
MSLPRHDEVESFWSFVRERHLVWHRKMRGYPRPWTTDHALATYHFTNVYRELDHGTVWFRSYLALRPPETISELLHAVITYRCVNRVSTFEELGVPYTPDELACFVQRVDEGRAQKRAMLTKRHQPNLIGLRKSDIVTDQLVQAVTTAPDGFDMAEAFRRRITYVGNFFAIQFVADILHTPWSHLSTDTIIPISAGSRLASELITTGQLGVNDKRNRMIRRDATRDELHVLRFLHDTQRAPSSMPMTHVDIEHALCEWYRWRIIQAGRASSKVMKYEPRDAA